MSDAFPKEEVDAVRKQIDVVLQSFPKVYERKFPRARALADSFFGEFYSFSDHLRTGYYVPYAQEKPALGIVGNNCTTIIPNLFMYCDAFGLSPKIVQFIDFEDIREGKKPDGELSPSHFSVIIDVGRKNPYLFDPFYGVFNPILRVGDNRMRLGRQSGRSAGERRFRQVIEYSAEDFASMMTRLKDPAESLDMLVAGQKVYEGKGVKNASCSLMVYYHDDTNTLSSRLYIPQPAISDKAVYCNMLLDEKGEVRGGSLDLFLSKKAK
jgi:hypothetical protein